MALDGWLTTGNLVYFGVPVFATYVVLLYLYRLTLHPLAKFPGPKLAAISNWYEFYYDVMLHGKFTEHIQKLHKQYGEPSSSYRITSHRTATYTKFQAQSYGSHQQNSTSMIQIIMRFSTNALAGETGTATSPRASVLPQTPSAPSLTTCTEHVASP